MYRIYHILAEKSTLLATDSEFINFIKTFVDENEDLDMPIYDAIDYLNTYCDHLALVPMPKTRVILEFYMEIWYCYKDGEGMNNACFTFTTYDDIISFCNELELDVIQEIDMSEVEINYSEE